MSLQNPFGLLALLSIPILIILYFILHKFKEKEISSTYIWIVSERFDKKRIPLSKISQPWFLLLQIIIAIVLSFALAQPIIYRHNQAENIYFIIDNSGSMNIKDSQKNRFEVAKDKIISVMEKAKNGSCFSIVTLCDNPRYIVKETESKDDVYTALESLSPSNIFSTIDDAFSIVQDAFREDPTIHAYYVTDKSYETKQNIDVINVAKSVDNYAISNCDYAIVDGHINVDGNLFSYSNDATLNIRLLVDDVAVKSQSVNAKKMQQCPFEFSILEIDFQKLTVEITNEDSLDLDNRFTIFAHKSRDIFKAAVVSDSPFYIERILKAIGYNEMDIYSSNTYKNEMGYDLYVFDGFAPLELPTDGGIWMFDVDANISNSGFVYQNQVVLDKAGLLNYSKDSNSLYKALTEGIMEDKIYISKYLKYSIYSSFSPILTYDGQPVVFAGLNDNLTREVVFAFDLHDSNLPLLMDFIVLFKNFVNYTVPEVMNGYVYQCGNDISINVLPNCESIKVTSPSQKISFLDCQSDSVVTYTLKEVGEYEIDVLANNENKIIKFYSSFSTLESNPTMNEKSISLIGEKIESERTSPFDLTFILLLLGIGLLLLDWIFYSFSKS